MIEKAYAKINICLNVVCRRDDGYHELEMIMVPLDLHDEIHIEFSNTSSISSNDVNMPTDNSNTILKAINIMKDKYSLKENFKVEVIKNIPMQAGLAGGSSDAAATIGAINSMCNLELSNDELIEVGKQVGADVPFFIINKPALVKGIGEKISPFEMKTDYHILLVKPDEGVSTKEAFETLVFETAIHPNVEQMKKGLSEGIEELIIHNLQNTLEQSAFKLVPVISQIKSELQEFGFERVLMSGSGSAVFALSENEELVSLAQEHFGSRYKFVRKTKIKG